MLALAVILVGQHSFLVPLPKVLQKSADRCRQNNGILRGGFFDLLYIRQVACTGKVVVVVVVVAPAKITF